jgi:hypothetical protein
MGFMDSIENDDVQYVYHQQQCLDNSSVQLFFTENIPVSLPLSK